MTGLYYDLHIHSCLSPCGDNNMTPANIVGMAAVKKLDVIALTDHNSCKNSVYFPPWKMRFVLTPMSINICCLLKIKRKSLAASRL